MQSYYDILRKTNIYTVLAKIFAFTFAPCLQNGAQRGEERRNGRVFCIGALAILFERAPKKRVAHH
jgi:hypothetical protein